jgi:hypothetical protein
MASLHAKTERAHGASDQYFASSSFSGFAGDFHAAGIESLDFITKA